PRVRDDEDGLAGVVAGDLADGALHARRERRERLGVGRAEAVAVLPAFVLDGEARRDLRVEETLPRAEVALAQLAHRRDADPASGERDPRRVRGAREVARVRRVERDAFEQTSEAARLLASEVGQRTVRLPEPAALAVPVGLAVTGDDERRHRAPAFRTASATAFRSAAGSRSPAISARRRPVASMTTSETSAPRAAMWKTLR